MHSSEEIPEAVRSSGSPPILLICDGYPPVLGGAEIEAQRVSAALVRKGYRVQILCPGGAPMPSVRDWVDPFNVPVRILGDRSKGKLGHCIFALQAAREIARSEPSAIIYFLNTGLHVAAGLPMARLLGRRMLMKISGDGVIPQVRRSLIGRLELGWLRKWSVPTLLLNPRIIEEATAAGLSPEQIVWMPNPVEIDEFRPARPGEASELREEFRIPANSSVAIYTGRLSQEKGLHTLLEAFSRARRDQSDALLLLLGDGPIRADLENHARSLRIPPESIRFVGRVPLSEVPRWLRASDVFLLTSPNEGFSCSLLEAMSCGLPSVVSEIPANTQLVRNGIEGLSAPANSIDEISEALSRLLGSPVLRETMGQAARKIVVENYATDFIIARYEALFQEMTSERKAPRIEASAGN